MSWRGWSLLLSSAVAVAACDGPPAVPERPTWADVEPILRGECNHCHGYTAPTTASIDGLPYRLDFYDMDPLICGEAAKAMDVTMFARAWSSLIASDVIVPPNCVRARMPPAPASPLADWERQTLLRWTAAPEKGLPRRPNTRPDIQLYADTAIADARLRFTAVTSDPDGEPVVGLLEVGSMQPLRMDHPGSFQADIDTSAWPAGKYPIRAVLCDGWGNFEYDLGNAEVKHSAP